MKEKYAARRVLPLGRVMAAVTVALMLCAQPSHAWVSAPKRILVTHDLGGPIAERMRRIERMRARGEGVAIPHGRCISACTLFLGLPATCVGKNAEFGFHGPSAATGGLGLSPQEFEQVSTAMAQYYPSAIRHWFLSNARFQTLTYFSISGADLIAAGVTECI